MYLHYINTKGVFTFVKEAKEKPRGRVLLNHIWLKSDNTKETRSQIEKHNEGNPIKIEATPINILSLQDRKKSMVLYNFDKLPKDKHKELIEYYQPTDGQPKDWEQIKKIIFKYKIMTTCSSCTYSNDDAAEWIENAINKKIISKD